MPITVKKSAKLRTYECVSGYRSMKVPIEGLAITHGNRTLPMALISLDQTFFSDCLINSKSLTSKLFKLSD